MNFHGTRGRVAAVLVAVAVPCLGGCGLMQKPTASIAGVKVQDVALTNATMLFDVKVDNPYSVPLPLTNLDYTLASEGQQFLTGKADVQGDVPANESKVLPIPIQISYAELVRVVKGAAPGATIPYNADLGLSVQVPALGPMRLPMSKEGQLHIPTARDLLPTLQKLAQ